MKALTKKSLANQGKEHNVEHYTVFRKKNTHSHFLSRIHELCVDLNKNCSEYSQGKVHSDNIESRYSLWLYGKQLIIIDYQSLNYAVK